MSLVLCRARVRALAKVTSHCVNKKLIALEKPHTEASVRIHHFVRLQVNFPTNFQKLKS